MQETLKIIGLSVVASVAYGEVHDQVTAHLCVEYFSVLHPHVIDSTSPLLLAMVWGVLATWWVGVILGLLLAITARLGSEPRLRARDMALPIAKLVGVMAVCAMVSGVLGYLYPTAVVDWRNVITLPAWKYPRLNAVWLTHNASYGIGIGGGLVLCILNVIRRLRLSKRTGTAEAVPV